MKHRSLIIAAVLALGIVIVAPLAFAQHNRGMNAMGGGFGGGMMLGHLQKAQKALGLSDDQVSQIKGIFQDLRTQNQPYRQSLHTGMQSIVQTLIANPSDTAAATSLLDQQFAAEHAMKLNTINAVAKALSVLTPDQRAKLGTFVQERMARHAAR